MLIHDVFEGAEGLFSSTSLTSAILETPYVPSTVRSLSLFQEERLLTTDVSLQQVEDRVELIPASERGAPGVFRGNERRAAVKIGTVRLAEERHIYADEIRNVMATGSLNLQTLEHVRNQKLAQIATNIDYTEEHLFLGAIHGKLLDADGSEMLNLFDVLGKEAPAPVGINLAGSENLKKTLQGVRRQVIRALGTEGNTGPVVHAFCGDAVWDELVALDEIKAAYDRFQEGQFLRDGGLAYERFAYAGIMFHNYHGNDQLGIEEGKIRFFPQVPGLFKVFYAPSDDLSSLGQLGLPRYGHAWTDERGKRINLEGQTNLVAICSKPQALIEGDVTLP